MFIWAAISGQTSDFLDSQNSAVMLPKFFHGPILGGLSLGALLKVIVDYVEVLLLHPLH
jgi:hypothetical protein